MIFRAIVFFPFSFFFWLVTSLRNKMIDWRWKKSRSFPVQTICIGNLCMGGSGKSPMVEYIIRLLKDKNRIATLSRGYKRKTKGYCEVSASSTSENVGDEPKQFKNKFPEITVAVCEDRCKGVEEISGRFPDTGIILLDDAFQHRKIKCGVNILLTDYHRLFTDDFIFPSGTLRESRGCAGRADVVVVTKCPADLDENGKRVIRKNIEKYTKGKVFFSFLKYAGLKRLGDGSILAGADTVDAVVIFTGIANPASLEKYIRTIFKNITTVRFPDHHQYSSGDLMRIQESFNNIAGQKKIIITTEKDAVRFEKPEHLEIIKRLPVYIASVEIEFFPADKILFNQILTTYAEHDSENCINDIVHSEKNKIRS